MHILYADVIYPHVILLVKSNAYMRSNPQRPSYTRANKIFDALRSMHHDFTPSLNLNLNNLKLVVNLQLHQEVNKLIKLCLYKGITCTISLFFFKNCKVVQLRGN